MQYTPNFNFMIAEGTDTVNLLTQCYPNFTNLDTILQAIKEAGVTEAVTTKVGTVHNIVRNVADCNVIRWVNTANYAAGDTFTVDGTPVTATTMDGQSLPAGAFVINQSCLAILNGTVLTFVGGAGSSTVAAEDVTYDNSGSGLTATDVQAAVDELAARPVVAAAEDVTYDNTVSGLTATDVQAAIDELASASAGETATVTADGVKNYKQILEALYLLIDASKITPNAVIVEDAGTFKNVCHLVRMDNSKYNFTRVYLSTTLDSLMFEVGATSYFKQGTGNTVSDASAVVPANGRTYKIIY